MPWFRLDDSFHSHPKVIAAGNEAIGLYVRCGTYAAEHLTDGFVPEAVALLYGSPALADKLVRAKLWRRTRGGWRMPDYLNYNPSREAVDNDRKSAANRQRRRREAVVSHRDTPRDSRVSYTTPSRPVVIADVVNLPDGSRELPPDIETMIIGEIQAATSRTIDPAWAASIATHILGGRTPANPASYIRQAIRTEPNPVQRFLPAY